MSEKNKLDFPMKLKIMSVLIPLGIMAFVGYMIYLSIDQYPNDDVITIKNYEWGGQVWIVDKITQDECFKNYGGSWSPPNNNCTTTEQNYKIAQLGDKIYLRHELTVRQKYLDNGYVIFNSTDTQTEMGFVLDVCDDFKITSMELYCRMNEQ